MALAMSSIRSRRNALSLPYRLPSEVLARCFWFLVAVAPPGPRSSLGWIRILHASAHFRHVALAEPTLWTEVTFILGLKWAGRMASLAKAAPLSIQWASEIYQSTPHEAIRDVVHNHISHIRELVIEEDLVSLSTTLDITEPAPILETLDLRLESVYSQIAGGYQILPPNFLSGSAPRLRTTKLSGFELSSTAFPLLSTVVSLSIEFPSRSPSCDTFFSMLKAAPRVEFLNLEYCLPNAAEDSSIMTSSALSIPLPHLAKLCVRGLTADCTFLLRHLNLPCSTRLEIDSHTGREESTTTNDSSSTLFAALLPHIQGEKSPHVRTLHISVGRDSVKVMAWELSGTQTGKEAPVFFHDSETATLSLKLKYPFYQSVSGPALLTLFDLSELQTLYLDMSGEVLEPDQWMNALRPCAQLQHGLIQGENSSSTLQVCCVLLPALHNGEAENLAMAGPSTAGVFLPNLISLDLCKVDVGGYAPGHSKPFHEVLVDLLSKRKALGKPLHRLSLRHCIVHGDWLGNLREVVSQVECDKETRDMSEEDEEDDDGGGYGHDEDYHYYSDPSDDLDVYDHAWGW